MTEVVYERARSLACRIRGLTEAIDKLSQLQYNLDTPSTKGSGLYISNYNGTEISLSEEEAVCIIRAFENLRDNLREEFRNL